MHTLKGWHVLLIAFAFFGSIIGVNVTMATLAVQTFSGEDEGNAYGHGLEYNETLARRAAERANGLTVDLNAQRAKDGSVEILARIVRNGAVDPGLTVKGEMHHPANEALDRPVGLQDRGDGTYVGRLDGLPAGQWDIVFNIADRSGELLEAQKRLWLP